MEYVVVVTRQIGVEAETHEEAVRQVLDDKGVIITTTYAANPRRTAAGISQGMSAADRLAAQEQLKKDATKS